MRKKKWKVLGIFAAGTLLSGMGCINVLAANKMEYNDHTYEYCYADTKLSWEEAKELCEKKGGHLVTIATEEEKEALEVLFDEVKSDIYYDKTAWAGGKYDGQKWTWITGEDWEYSNWFSDESYSNCEENPYMTVSESWVTDYSWSNKGRRGYCYYYICEWEPSAGGSGTGTSVDVTKDYFTVDSTSYVIPDSDSRYVSASELKEYSGLFLMLARNEIYARRGYMFRDQNIQKYFNYKDWYKGTVPADEFTDVIFNKYEQANVDAIVEEENARGGAVLSISWEN